PRGTGEPASSPRRRVLPDRPAGRSDRRRSGRRGLLPRGGRPARRRAVNLVRVVNLVVPRSNSGGRRGRLGGGRDPEAAWAGPRTGPGVRKPCEPPARRRRSGG